MSEFSLTDVQERTYKSRDAWWTVYLVDPMASRLVVGTANRTSLTPNQLTVAALVLGLGAAGCFAMASWPWLVAGALLFHLSFVLDCMDGKIARLKGNGTIFGSWLDYVFDRMRVLVCAIALMGGQYAVSGEQVFIWFAVAIVFTDMFRYLNGPQMAKVRAAMRKKIARAIRDGEAVDEDEEATADDERATLARQAVHQLNDTLSAQQNDEALDAEGEPVAVLGTNARATRVQATELQRGFFSRFPWYARFRDTLMRHRVRPHLVSGIEFQMGTFIIAPLVGAVTTTGMLTAIALSAAGMLAFEALLVYKLWLSTKEFTRVVSAMEEASPLGDETAATNGASEASFPSGGDADATTVVAR
ncbi:phosphatidylglycerophosphate synthase [Lipingzhangella halophila]|uniref:Phosphatidylglycerophosphate synthase n=1 Tax=Lipingzhangella halophila TaxID=1783352 RepID=A0A7W7W5C2_9ACTN|nr:CDP-alcohol phosphatidyltransferase family protein [Lipingzhangella halophila]MBB4934558.1 phosphatidylglycerophosphate synthase [Lipingzhangella halophila]